jgi:hypothetical protein
MSNANASTDDNKLGGVKKMSNVNASASADNNKLGGVGPLEIHHHHTVSGSGRRGGLVSESAGASLGWVCRTLPKMESERLVRRNERTARKKKEKPCYSRVTLLELDVYFLLSDGQIALRRHLDEPIGHVQLFCYEMI